MSVITLTTDFGSRDWFVGAMKGVIASVDPNAKVVDITHDLAPGDIRRGAFVLAAGYYCFPRGTVHVAVIDPGVGSARPAIAVETNNYHFVGPDNGLLSWALRNETIHRVCRLENSRYWRLPVSQTFHGRDIFAPVAAHLSLGVPIQSLGPAGDDFIRLPWPAPTADLREIRGEVMCVDHFGNAISNISASNLPVNSMVDARIAVRGHAAFRLAACYQAVKAGRPLGIIGSSGFLEIAVNAGHAAKRLRLKPGSSIVVRLNQA